MNNEKRNKRRLLMYAKQNSNDTQRQPENYVPEEISICKMFNLY